MARTRAWFFLIALLGALVCAAGIVTIVPLRRYAERETGNRLWDAQRSASLMLKINARKWIDMAGQVATDAVLVEALAEATRGPADLGIVHKTAEERLRYFREKLRVDFVWATDARGRVIGRAGLDEGVYKDGIEGFPLVGDALRGLRSDDTWSLGRKLYRVTASPVIAASRDRYAGALVIGQEVANELALQMKRKLDVDVAVFVRGQMVASTTTLPFLGEVPRALARARGDLRAKGRSAPMPFESGAETWMLVLAPFEGEAAEHDAAYALLAPVEPPLTIAALQSHLLEDKPWKTLLPVGVGLVFVLIVGFALIHSEATGPLRRLRIESQSLARGDSDFIDDSRLPGGFGTIARAVNMTIERLQAALKPAPPAMDAGLMARPRRATAPRMPPPALAASAALAETPALGLEHLSSHERAFDELDTNLVHDTDESVLPDFAPPPTVPGSPTRRAPPLPMGLRKNHSEEHTAVAQPSEELLAAARDERSVSPPPGDDVDDDLQKVYRDFIATKQQCGEPVEGITYEKFSGKLRINREQLISRYSCKTVRFQVYVKDGKAALRATPITS